MTVSRTFTNVQFGTGIKTCPASPLFMSFPDPPSGPIPRALFRVLHRGAALSVFLARLHSFFVPKHERYILIRFPCRHIRYQFHTRSIWGRVFVFRRNFDMVWMSWGLQHDRLFSAIRGSDHNKMQLFLESVVAVS